MITAVPSEAGDLLWKGLLVAHVLVVQLLRSRGSMGHGYRYCLILSTRSKPFRTCLGVCMARLPGTLIHKGVDVWMSHLH